MLRRYSRSDLATLGSDLSAPLPAPKKRSQEESIEQKKVMCWWEGIHSRFCVPLCTLHSVPNGGFRSEVTASIMKAEGQRRGVFDLKLNVSRQGKHGLWLEMKARNGVISPEQRTFKTAMEGQGYATAVCYSSAEAIDTITFYLTHP